MTMTDVNKIFAQRLKETRLDAKMSQEHLAELAGLHRTYVSAVERGERNISLKNVQRIAEALEVQPYQLLKP